MKVLVTLAAVSLMVTSHAHAQDTRYERQKRFARRLVDLSSQLGVAYPQGHGDDAALVLSETAFVRLSPVAGGPSLALDIVRRTHDGLPTRNRALLYLAHRLPLASASRFDPWVEILGIGLDVYRPALGLDVFLFDEVRLGGAAKFPMFFSQHDSLFEMGVEFTCGLTIQLGPRHGRPKRADVSE